MTLEYQETFFLKTSIYVACLIADAQRQRHKPVSHEGGLSLDTAHVSKQIEVFQHVSGLRPRKVANTGKVLPLEQIPSILVAVKAV